MWLGGTLFRRAMLVLSFQHLPSRGLFDYASPCLLLEFHTPTVVHSTLSAVISPLLFSYKDMMVTPNILQYFWLSS